MRTKCDTKCKRKINLAGKMLQKKAGSAYRLNLIILAASIASLGTIPYGYQFAQCLGPTHYLLAVVAGILLGLTAATANTALGVYSFLNMNAEKSSVNIIYLLSGSVVSAIPMGFMCYFAYH